MIEVMQSEIISTTEIKQGTRLCKLCNKPFVPKRSNQKYCKDRHFKKCEYCGKEFEIVDKTYIYRTCSDECSKLLRKKNAEATSLKKYGVKNAGGTAESKAKVNATCRAKYGVDWTGQAAIQKQHVQETWAKLGGNPMQREECRQKARQTNLERYGAETPLSKNSSVREHILQRVEEKYGTRDPGNLPEFREKARQTCLKHYGTEYYFQSEEGKRVSKERMIEKYGVDHPMHSPEIIERQKQAIRAKYGVDYPSQVPEVKEKISNTVMQKYGVPYFCMHPDCKSSQGAQPSRICKSFNEMLESVKGISTEYEFRIGNKSFDIRIKDSNILIEIDPTYTHTTVETKKFGSVAKDYQYNKSKIAEDAGYRCIHVFDWDNWSQIIDLVSPKNKVYARNCTIAKLDNKTTNQFLAAYHLQNTCKGQEHRYGLYYNGELVQVMTFGKPRYNRNNEWELLRLCTKPQLAIVGGSNKLFKAFLKEVKPKSIVSYCDRAKFSGVVYYNLGFKLTDIGSPSKHWSYGQKHITDNLLRQRGYDQLFGTNYGKGTSNEQLMLDNHWLPVYDCGQARFEWRAC